MAAMEGILAGSRVASDEPVALPRLSSRADGHGADAVARRRRRPGLRPQGDRRRPRELGQRARSAPGRGALQTASPVQLIAILNASPITEIRTAAVSGSPRAARPARSRARSRSSAPACRDARTSTRCRRCSTTRSSASGAGTAHAEALALETHSLVAASIEEALERRRHRLHGHLVERAGRRARDGSRPARTSTPSGAFPDGKSRELSTATVVASRLFVDRRESTLNEAGDYRSRPPRAASGPSTSSPSSERCSTGTVEGRRPTRS